MNRKTLLLLHCVAIVLLGGAWIASAVNDIANFSVEMDSWAIMIELCGANADVAYFRDARSADWLPLVGTNLHVETMTYQSSRRIQLEVGRRMQVPFRQTKRFYFERYPNGKAPFSTLAFNLGFPIWIPLTLLLIYPSIRFLRGPLVRYRRTLRGQCRHCGYDLTGNLSGRCPECGTAAKALRSEGAPDRSHGCSSPQADGTRGSGAA